MALSILANVASLRAQRQLNQASDQLERTYERLASGQRINRASDDPAGLAIGASLRRDARLATVALRNANDGVSYVAIGDAALSEIGNILNRMAELAEQSANGSITTRQRSPLQAEFDALGSEIERIALTTNFNGINILSGGANLVVQVGFNSQDSSRVTIRGVEGTLQAIRLSPGGSSALTYSVIATTDLESQAAARTALDAVYAAINDVSARRGTLGASESRLHSTISNLSSARLNFEAAASKIFDADVAQDVANLLRLKIVQEGAAAILAQANQQPALALKLLKTEAS